MYTNPLFGTDNSHPNYTDPYGSQPSTWPPSTGQGGSSQPSMWQSVPYPQAQPILEGGYSQPSTWQSGPYSQAQAQSILGGGSSRSSTWQTGPYPQAQAQPILRGGNSQPSTWQTGPYPQAQAQPILRGGNSQPSTWLSGPYPQAQAQPILGGASSQPSTWQTGPYTQVQAQPILEEPYARVQAQPILGEPSTWQTGPYPQVQAQPILGGGSSQPSTWLLGPYPQAQPIFGGGINSQPSTWQSAPYPQARQQFGLEGGISQPSTWQSSQPILGGGSWQPYASQPPSVGGGESWQLIPADQQDISHAKIKNEEKIDDTSTAAKAITKVERIVDPDGESSCLCSGCRLPIFSTPSISFSHGGDHLFLHEQCHRLPPQWLHELHPEHALVLLNHLQQPPPPDAAATTCHNCEEICGTLFYQCPNPSCHFRLDLLCVLQLKIMHRSHKHTMTVIRQKESSSLTCSACDTIHKSPSSEAVTLSYLCNLCGYWIHPDCASLLNSILHNEKHQHSLFLTYNLPTSTDSKCAICSEVHKMGSGVFLCLNCTNYLVHINCALQNPDTFKPVFIRDAKASVLGRLPLPNENSSLIPYINTQDGDAVSDYYDETFHAHPLTSHQTDDGDQSCRVCNACVQSVSPPFYSCSQCPDFFLHSCCAHLPTNIRHRAHKEHRLLLTPKAPKFDNIFGGFSCKGCHLWCNGFVYSCETCDDFTLDVVCAMINPAITHEPHKSTHILFMSRDIQFGSNEKCNCCSSSLKGICYECTICPNFKLHVKCALLPNTVCHVFDEHPLRLTTKESKAAAADAFGGGGDELCEVCEEHIKKEVCNYSCSECNQSFHVDCIPSIDQLSRIKLGSNVRVDVHDCPVALVRRDNAVCGGRRCGSCREILKLCDDRGLAYECSKCFFGLCQNCAKKRLLKS